MLQQPADAGWRAYPSPGLPSSLAGWFLPRTPGSPRRLPCLQLEAERQQKIRQEVKHELRMFYCEVGPGGGQAGRRAGASRQTGLTGEC